MAKRTNYEDYIPWPLLKNHLLMLRQHAFNETLNASGLQEMGKAQGKALAFDSLLNLPELLMIREEGLKEEG